MQYNEVETHLFLINTKIQIPSYICIIMHQIGVWEYKIYIPPTSITNSIIQANPIKNICAKNLKLLIVSFKTKHCSIRGYTIKENIIKAKDK